MENKKTILMSKLWETKISYFPSVKNNDTSTAITLKEWMTKYSSRYLYQVLHVREQYNMYLRGECDKKTYQDLKSYILPVCTPSCLIEGKRSTDNVKRLTGIICIDIDGLKDDEIEKIKMQIIKLPYCFCTAKSVSGHGIYAMIAYNKNNDFKATFLSLKNKFNDMGIEIDNACSDYTRTRFISFDKNTLIKKPETEIEVYDDIQVKTTDTNITELETNEEIRHNENIDYLLLTKSIYFLIQNNYGKRKYEYNDWLMDGYRLASLDNSDIGFKLFLLISKNAKGFTSSEDVMRQFKACRFNNRWQNNITYYYGLCKKIIGDNWINKINDIELCLR